MPNIDFVLRSARAADPIGTQVTSIRHWPASGGGILISARISAFAGDSGALRNIDTFYLRIDHCGALTAITPYVVLGQPALLRLLAFIDDELLELSGSLDLPPALAVGSPRCSELEQFAGELDFKTEIVVRACSATLVSLLASAELSSGASITEAASLASLEALPAHVILRSGLDLALRQATPRVVQPTTNMHTGGLHA